MDLQALVTEFCADVDDVFNQHRDDSEITRLNRGEDVARSAELREVLALAVLARELTGGRFDHERGGRIDLYAIAKGWAAQRLAVLLHTSGYDRVGVNAGGDLYVIDDTDTWTVGIQHPDDTAVVFHTLRLHRGAVATSGTYERAGHLGDKVRTRSVTVAGPDAALADAFATAAALCAPDRLDWLPEQYWCGYVPLSGQLWYQRGTATPWA